MPARNEELLEGVIVKGPYWSEEVRIHVLKTVGTRIKIIGTGIKTKKSYQAVYSKDEFLTNVEIIGGIEGPKFTANPKQFRLALEAKRIKLSYEFDPLFAVGVSKIEPLPHQIEAVYDYLLKKPRIRFLLADDPGAGKTIMAGLLLKELKYRKAIDKVLIVTPPALITQWERELSEKFGENFVKIDRGTIKSFGPKVWEQHNQFLVSLDFGSRSEDILEQLKNVSFTWDLVIVDEAHKLSAYKYGDQTKESLRYKFGKVLSDTSEHLLFLTATPHKGDPENFRLLLNLLEKDLYANKDLITEAIRNKENPIMLRRLKEDMRYEDGRPIFPERKVQTIPYNLTSNEEVLYNAVTEYVQQNFEKAERLVNERVAISLALIVLQRRLASSVRAIRKSLERRYNRLNERLSVWDSPPKEKETESVFEEDEIEDMTESDRWEVENKSLGLTTARSKEELKEEILEVQRLVELAKNVEREGNERKLNELRRCIDIEEIRNSDEKLLIFTEHKDTLDYLLEKVEQWGFSVTHIDGSMAMDERRQAEDDFKNKCQIMIATEAAGEGINLQFCKLMVNYDIPWNPTRLEQRMGRIHRFGQKYEVHIYNLIAKNTREGAVLQTILEKLEQMKAHLGGDRVYDVISEIFEQEGIKLENVLRNAILNRKSLELFQKLNQIEMMNIDEKIARASEEALATKYVDLPRFKEKKELADEYRLIPEYIEQFFVEGLHNFEGRAVKIKEGIYRLEEVPVIVRKKSKDIQTQKSRYYSQVTFNKDLVEEGIDFIAPGHPLFDAVADLVLEKYGETLSEGAIFYDPEANEESILWFVKGIVNDGKGKVMGEKLFAVYQKKNNELSIKGPFIIWDLNPCDKAPKYKPLFTNISQNEELVSDWTISNLVEPYFKEIKEQIFDDLDIKLKYLKRSLNFLINKKMEKEQEYVQKEQKGKDMKLLLLNVRRDLEDYKYRKDELLSEIEKEKNLSMGLPEVVAIIGLVPFPIEDDETLSKLKRDDETEKIGMKVAMDYEIKNKRTPTDVSKDNDGCGFDIKSRGNGELRYIEVKSWKKDGGAFLTNNEWIKAKRLGDKYWLYVVTNCAKEPVLRIIQNPAEKLIPEKIEKVVRWLIDSQQIKKKGEEIKK